MHDVLCVGFGPANIALAVAMDELWPGARVKYLERAPAPCWQPDMLLDGADIQNNPLRDLVTPRNPRSRFTFLNYLHENGRLFKHLNLPSPFPLRKEYADYVRWVADRVPADVDFGQDAVAIRLAAGGRRIEVRTAAGRTYCGRSLVLAPGRSPHIPPPFARLRSRRVFHTSGYLRGVADLRRDWTGTVAVVGASQSAIEVVLDLIDRFPNARIVNVMSGFGYRLKDTSPFSEEVYFPEFVPYFYTASEGGKARLRGQLRATNYSAADRDVIDALYLRLYEDEVDGRTRVTLRTNQGLTRATLADGRVVLGTTDHITGEDAELRADLVVLATGYQDLGVGDREQHIPPLLAEVAALLEGGPEESLPVGLDYRVPTPPGTPPVYLNGLCESTHGFGDAGSFSLLALRTQTIVESLRRALGDAPAAGPPDGRVVADLARARAATHCTCPARPRLTGAQR